MARRNIARASGSYFVTDGGARAGTRCEFMPGELAELESRLGSKPHAPEVETLEVPEVIALLLLESSKHAPETVTLCAPGHKRISSRTRTASDEFV
jgi:hypothetical protein